MYIIIFSSINILNGTASIRIPIYTVEHGWRGDQEDRRPASNADPYRVTARIIETVREAHEKAMT
jgi:glutamine synthetase